VINQHDANISGQTYGLQRKELEKITADIQKERGLGMFENG
jgi:hypothetical protein